MVHKLQIPDISIANWPESIPCQLLNQHDPTEIKTDRIYGLCIKKLAGFEVDIGKLTGVLIQTVTEQRSKLSRQDKIRGVNTI
jgi:hypothetical protein